MWYVAEYQPTSLFNLRPANATVSGGKTLVVPTPFAIKMALLDAAIRLYGTTTGKDWFPDLRDLLVSIRLSKQILLTKTFVKILRPRKSNKPVDDNGTGIEGVLQRTIAYREMVFFSGPIQIALSPTKEGRDVQFLSKLFPQIHYLGKRGSFMQFIEVKQYETLSSDFSRLNPTGEQPFNVQGLLQMLDDWGSTMSFEAADIYSGKKILFGKENGRIINSIVLPYHPVRSARSFTLYERLN